MSRKDDYLGTKGAGSSLARRALSQQRNFESDDYQVR
jgi:hypothetical protein